MISESVLKGMEWTFVPDEDEESDLKGLFVVVVVFGTKGVSLLLLMTLLLGLLLLLFLEVVIPGAPPNIAELATSLIVKKLSGVKRMASK